MASMDISNSCTNDEVVAHALSLSRGDQEGLADFLTDYFGSSELEDLGKRMHKIHSQLYKHATLSLFYYSKCLNA